MIREEKSAYKIEVRDIVKTYKMYNSPMERLKEALSLSGKVRHTDFNALSNITFTVNGGEILGIMGRNGAGKSTLLKIITGVLTATSGTVSVKGRVSSLLELGTGFNFEYTGIENIYFYATLMGLSKKEIDLKLDEIINFAEIGDYVNQPVKTYSSGMFARLAFSCAINVDPDILIVDEILSVGDMRFQSKCFNKFKEFRDKGVTILYVGHDVSMMRTFCDKAMWMNNGEIVDIGDPTFISAKYTEFMYLEDISSFTLYKKFDEDAEMPEVEAGNVKENITTTLEVPEVCSKFKDTIAHWGTNVGMITSVKLIDNIGKEKNHFMIDEYVKIEVVIDSISEIEMKYFSIAFSIKNKEGTDLIVKSTFDEEISLEKAEGKIRVTFKLKTNLAKGEYYLVVALENRKNASISYYEYIEGVKYFKIYTDKKVFGVVDADVEIKIY